MWCVTTAGKNARQEMRFCFVALPVEDWAVCSALLQRFCRRVIGACAVVMCTKTTQQQLSHVKKIVEPENVLFTTQIAEPRSLGWARHRRDHVTNSKLPLFSKRIIGRSRFVFWHKFQFDRDFKNLEVTQPLGTKATALCVKVSADSTRIRKRF